MRAVVCVPWRGGEPHRERAWAFLRQRWETDGWEVFEASGPPGPMRRSLARNLAAKEAGEWDVGVFADADTFAPDKAVRKAVLLAEETGKLVYPFTECWSLTPKGTRQVYAGEPRPWDARWSRTAPGGIVCVPRSLFRETNGWDERFVGWGFEDAAFRAACLALRGELRVDGDAWHLWHPRSKEKQPGLPEYQANKALGGRYKAARKDPDEMRRILAER